MGSTPDRGARAARPSVALVHSPVSGGTADRGARALRDLLARSVRALRTDLEAELDTIPAQVADLSRRLVALDRRLPAAARRMRVLRDTADLASFAAAELERVLAVPGVSEVETVGTALVVSTDPIRIRWNGVARDLGAYRVMLDLAGDVRVESVERLGPRPAWDHPHVQAGLPCLGNLREGVLKLIAEYELALAAQVLLDFLHSYQPETAYTPIEGWPAAGQEQEQDQVANNAIRAEAACPPLEDWAVAGNASTNPAPPGDLPETRPGASEADAR